MLLKIDKEDLIGRKVLYIDYPLNDYLLAIVEGRGEEKLIYYAFEDVLVTYAAGYFGIYEELFVDESSLAFSSLAHKLIKEDIVNSEEISDFVRDYLQRRMRNDSSVRK